jgi:hypothetical protein
VVLYLLAAGSCWISARELVLEDIGSNERRAWWAISVLFLALGINKQLDLQSALIASQWRQVGIAKSVSRSVHLNQGN